MKLIICIAAAVLMLYAEPTSQTQPKNNSSCSPKPADFKLVRLYELYRIKTNTYFYTISLKEIDLAIKNKGYVRKRVVALVAVSETDCKGGDTLVPIYRWYSETRSDYWYATKDDKSHEEYKDYKMEGIAYYGAKDSKCGADTIVYRFWTGTSHIYTKDLKEGHKIIAGTKGSYEKILCNIWPIPTSAAALPSNCKPEKSCKVELGTLYRLHRPHIDSYLYTTSLFEAHKARDNLNYILETLPDLVALNVTDCKCENSLQPIYRAYRINPEDYFYTNNEEEAAMAVEKLGHVREGIAFYCASKEGQCGAHLPLHRYAKKGLSHFYTTDLSEGTEKIIKKGGTYEGIMCYIWKN